MLAALGVGGGLFALACSTAPGPAAPASPVTLYIGVPQSRQLDPTHGAPTLANQLSFDRLTATGPDGRATPKLIDRWEVAPDGLTWRLFLRPGVVFQDGEPLTAAEVKQEIDEIVRDPGTRDSAACVPDITSIAAEGDRELRIGLRRRCSYLLDELDFTIARRRPDGRRIGTGPFTTLSRTADEIVMEANRRYYLGAPSIDRIVFRPYDALRSAWAEMLRGRVDFLWEVAPDTVEFVRDQSEVRVHAFLGYYVYTLVFNSGRPLFGDPRVRRALDLAVDREAILQQALRGHGIPADGPVWPRHWTHDPSSPAARYNPADAAALLDQALGRARPAAGPGTSGRLQFTCLIPVNFTLYERIALLVQKQLWDINVDMRLEAVRPDVFNGRIRTGEFDAVVLPIAGGPFLGLFHRFWHSPDPLPRWNYWHYRDATVDAALEDLRDAADDGAMREATRRMVQGMRDDPPALFLVWGETTQAMSRRFDIPTETGRDALSGIWRWRPRTGLEAAR